MRGCTPIIAQWRVAVGPAPWRASARSAPHLRWQREPGCVPPASRAISARPGSIMLTACDSSCDSVSGSRRRERNRHQQDRVGRTVPIAESEIPLELSEGTLTGLIWLVRPRQRIPDKRPACTCGQGGWPSVWPAKSGGSATLVAPVDARVIAWPGSAPGTAGHAVDHGGMPAARTPYLHGHHDSAALSASR